MFPLDFNPASGAEFKGMPIVSSIAIYYSHILPRCGMLLDTVYSPLRRTIRNQVDTDGRRHARTSPLSNKHPGWQAASWRRRRLLALSLNRSL